MSPKATALLAAALLALSPALQAGEAASGHDHHGHAAPQKLQLNAGKPWPTDASLRQAMGNINQAMAEALPRIHKNRFTPGDYQGLAAKVQGEIAYAVENCRLEPEADAMLHLVIADLAGGAEAMAGKGKASGHDGAVKVLAALQSYGRYFDHPGWRAAGANH
ncbi:MAG TPA: hypothetical protein VJ576_14265 [Rhodocyclaceae bacterium]|nr:hypothetical protein [Rhodocyclaceae bacterium]